MSAHSIISNTTHSTLEEKYFTSPHSSNSLARVFQIGLLPVVVLAMMSIISIALMLGCITRRLIFCRTSHREFVGYNQYVILIYQLLLADLQQSIAFAISIYWLQIDKILAPTVPCFLQAWFLHIGNVASGFFVLAIAIHTWLGVVRGYKMPYNWFVASVAFIWFVSLALTISGPIMHGSRFFTQAGGWCWVSSDFQQARLYLHYLWIFIIEFGTVAIYGHIFLHIRGRINAIPSKDTTKLTRATKFMLLYPAVYVILTLPISVGRMVAMSGVHLPDVFFCIAGSFLTSCGWIDAILYTLTRRILNDDMDSSHCDYNLTAVTANPLRPGDMHELRLQSSMRDKEPITAVARTVTIIGGGGTTRLSRVVDQRRGRDLFRPHGPEKDLPREPSPTGSLDNLTKPPSIDRISVVTQTDVRVEMAIADQIKERYRVVSRSVAW